MITGAHMLIYSTDASADRAFLRDVLRFPSVDVGDGWLIFALPPAEVAVHPAEHNDAHELFLMCEDLDATIAEVGRHGVVCEPVAIQTWGRISYLTLPGGGRLGVYQPSHTRPEPWPRTGEVE